MPYSYSEAWKEAVASVDSTARYINTITFTHSSFSQAYRYAQSDTDLELEGVIYKGKQFDLSLASIEKGGNKGISVSVSNVTSQIVVLFRTAIQTKEPILVELRNFIQDRPSASATFATKLFVRTVSFKDSDMSLTAGYPDSANKRLPKQLYNNFECPGLRN